MTKQNYLSSILTVCDLTSAVSISTSSRCALCTSLFGIGLVPLLGDLFLPIWLLSNFCDAVLDDGKSLSDFIVLHVLLVVKFVCELKQFIDFCLLILFNLLFSLGPCGSLRATLLRALLASSSALSVQVLSCELHWFGGRRNLLLFWRWRLLNHGHSFLVLSIDIVAFESLDFLTLASSLVLEGLSLLLLVNHVVDHLLALDILLLLKLLQEFLVAHQDAVWVRCKK